MQTPKAFRVNNDVTQKELRDHVDHARAILPKVNDELQRGLTRVEEMSTGAAEQPQPATAPLFVHVRVLDEEDTHGATEEASLVRKRDTNPSSPPTSAHGDAAMADLNEMETSRSLLFPAINANAFVTKSKFDSVTKMVSGDRTGLATEQGWRNL